MNHNVFISYKSEEYHEASWVKSCLEENGLKCWMAPDSIPGGKSYADEIVNAIKKCQVLVLILSEKAQTSNHIKKEIDLALNGGKPILPFMIENCKLQEAFNYYLTDVQRYNAFENKSTEIKKMVNQIQNIVCGDNTVKETKIIQSFDIDMRTARAFASCGNETTVFKLKKTQDGQGVSANINFEKTRLRDEIPEFAGIYYIKHPPVDISGKNQICFNACSEDNSIETIWVEIKPEGKKWMHESFDFCLTDKITKYCIDISDFEYPETAKCVEEITFVLKPISFANENRLTGEICISNISIE